MIVSFSKLPAVSTGVANTPVALGVGGKVCAKVILYCPKTNTVDVIIGPDNLADVFEISPGQTLELPGFQTPNIGVDLGTWYVQATVNNQSVKAVYVPVSS